MQPRVLKANFLLLCTALIWGTAFVAQRVGMDHITPLMYNGLRFALACVSLVPLILWQNSKGAVYRTDATAPRWITWGGPLIAGILLFTGANLQQVGLVYTTAGNAGFITGLYVVIVPFLGIFLGQRPGKGGWVGAVVAAVGLFLLSVTEEFTIGLGDFYCLIGAVVWACHVLAVGWFSPKLDGVKLALGQDIVCAVLSLIGGFLYEDFTMQGIVDATIPILYGGIMSVGVAYTLQVVAQRDAQPAHAAVILSLEAAFAALAGWVILGEILSTRGLVGCGLMLTGMLIAQLWVKPVIPAVE